MLVNERKGGRPPDFCPVIFDSWWGDITKHHIWFMVFLKGNIAKRHIWFINLSLFLGCQWQTLLHKEDWYMLRKKDVLMEKAKSKCPLDIVQVNVQLPVNFKFWSFLLQPEICIIPAYRLNNLLLKIGKIQDIQK